MSTAKRLVLSLRGRKESQSTAGTSSTRLVSANSTSPGHELDEIAVVSGGAESSHVSYGSLSLGHTNGPRYIPDDDGKACFDDTKLSRHHSHSLNGTDAAIMHLAPPPLEAVGSDFNTIQTSSEHNRNSVSRQSLMDIVSAKLGMSGPQLGQSISQQGFFSSRDSLAASGTSRPLHSHVSATTSEMDLSRKDRKRERSKLKASDQPLLGSWSRTGPRESNAHTMAAAATRASSNHLVPQGVPGSTCNGADRYIFGRRSGCSTSSRKSNGRRWSFVFDPAGRLCYYWSMVVSMAFLYNFWVIIYRFAFQEINGETIVLWFCLDYFSDFLYLVDILFHFRTGYLEDGVLQTDSTKLRQHYMNSTTFYIDCLCLLPLDFLYLSIGFNSILRSFRLVKIYRFWAFMDRTERHTNYPNLFRSTSLIHYLLVIFHWNGCLYHIIYKNNGFGSKNWVFHDSESADVVKQYLQSYYWCTLALTTIGDLPRPRSKAEYVFVIAQLLFGLMLFATVLGHVANIVTSVSAARKEFQAKLDGVKTYMRMRRVPNHLQVKVIKWFDYLWLTQKCSDEERAVSCLPDKLKAEIAINVHLDTLKRVEIFQNTEAGFLCELVLKLRPVLFSPGDFICRKGEVGKEMYIVNRGRLQVVADNGKTVMASLKAGSYFGEISILNMGTAGKALGNRRTASVRSVGYSDLFVLSKKDMWDVLKEYPAARVRLEAIAVKRLEKYKKAPLEKVAMGRCQSTPGLVETRGRTTFEDMWISPTTAITSGSSMVPTYPPPPGSRMTSPRSHRGELSGSRQPQSPGSVSPSVHSSEERPRSRTTSHQTSRPQSQPSRTTGRRSICDASGLSTNSRDFLGPPCDSLTHIESSGATPLLGSHEALEGEIKRLRERLHTVESENFSLNAKLAQQQWEVEHRLAEIEMQICGASSASSISQENETEDLERNRESII
ncbi:potassium/sodium hyperpolarization-activated cyclic nucleotide-gated channel 1 isoform X1 [Topomyia yanbarensis]|uniref:potassium/sodium hyperpolarization-activated cyclic nucleotide-gated channel 1 isoform X1 n=1 Tax=Topomyia yanbarensis TaxID=2498891 RepID=UPI00273B60AD|nr:potassium/sodium hyperpolarization-activated cyclic nucleotide-gated channel 1 isoform X1 [Topomyia yanbarensis]XP_058830937.1 potassium/sodium hyperpolarization-activated cyclic nucleotide-gated channel 1 isoform X1 [Topomyia yanbarensis]